MADLDIIIPVYNEGENILPVLESLHAKVRTPHQVYICYDLDDDNTLPAVKKLSPSRLQNIVFAKNEKARGPHGAVLTGFERSQSPAVLVIPADDDYNAPIIDSMVQKAQEGFDIVSASRFIPGGCMKGCPWAKALLVRLSSLILRYVTFLPCHDATNGFRLFSRRILNDVKIESNVGFTYSIELLVKTHRLGYPIAEVPAQWFQRKKGRSRFQLMTWLIPYTYWLLYSFGTTYLRRGPISVPFKAPTYPPQPNLPFDEKKPLPRSTVEREILL